MGSNQRTVVACRGEGILTILPLGLIAIAKNTHLKNAAIAVQTNAGIVSLTGEVQDIMTSANASWTVWYVPGVKSVKNDLTLKEKK